MQHQGDNCHLNLTTVDFRALEGGEWTCKEPISPVLGDQPVEVVDSCSSAGFAAHEPGQSDATETCSISHGWVGGAHCGSCSSSTGENIKVTGVLFQENFTRSRSPPRSYLGTAFPAVENSKPHICLSEPSP